MGSLTSKAKTISQPQTVYYQPDPATLDPGPTAEEQAAETRRKNLLSRDRGRFGTIQTGFRGLLDIASSLGNRKTLLGE